jgi:methionyl-tRNA formyltransferase
VIDIAFLGSHRLGVECLRRLDDHPDVSIDVVVTYPPNEDNWWNVSVYDVATSLGHDTLEIDEEDQLLDRDVDWILSVYYPNILDAKLLEHPTEGALNLHQAELPRYRGSNVFSHSIMNARDDDHWKHGTTLHFMAPQVDAGDIVARRFAEIRADDTARSLYERVRDESVTLFEEHLPNIVDGTVHEMRTPQEEYEGERYYYSKDSLTDLKEIPADLLSDDTAQTELYDHIRALDFPPHKPAWTRVDGEKIYLTKDGYSRVD